MAMSAKEKRFSLTGFTVKEKKIMISIIKSLGAMYVHHPTVSEAFTPSCTHVVAKKQSRSEKYLCACGTGKWLLVENYLTDSFQAKKWLNEEDYEWSGKHCGQFPSNMQEAQRRWRKALQDPNGVLPFEKWVVGIRSFPQATELFKRLVEVNGGKGVVLPCDDNAKITLVIADKAFKDDVQAYHERKIPTVRCEFLAYHILQHPQPSVESFSLFPDSSEMKPTSSSQEPSIPAKPPVSDIAIVQNPLSRMSIFSTPDLFKDDKQSFEQFLAPEWLKKKTPLIKQAINKIKLDEKIVPSPMASEQTCFASHNVAPRRFPRKELNLIQIFVGNVRSCSEILLSSQMLLSRFLYPPPDLLYLLMKKFVLDSECAIEAGKTISFLNTVFLQHPPTSPHMQNDDVYTQALGITNATESTLLALAKLKVSTKISLWNKPSLESVEWSFLEAVIKQSMSSDSTVRRQNAILLLSFLSSVIELHAKLTKQLFWPSSTKCMYSSAVKLLFVHFRKAIEAYLASTSSSMVISDDDSEEEEEEDNEEDTEGDDEERDVEISETSMTADVFECLTTIINAMIKIATSEKKGKSSSPSFVDVGLAEVFSDVDVKVLENVMATVDLPSKASFIRVFLESNFRSDLAKVAEDTCLSLQLIVDRYFHFLPKPPTLVAKEGTHEVSNERSAAKVRSSSSDKENCSKPLASSPAAGSRSLTAASVNRRNMKGETALHKACMQNHPDRVVELLSITGIDPNARDNAGWTPLGEACNHGNADCVRELLRLPLASSAGNTDDAPPRLEIDVLACPLENGMTPLHDALNNGHIEVARQLLEKGGTALLGINDRQGKTPVDLCATEEMSNLVLELACEIASSQNAEDAAFSSTQSYEKVLPPPSLLTCSDWKKNCSVYVNLIRHLVSAHMSESKLFGTILHLSVNLKPLAPRDEQQHGEENPDNEIETATGGDQTKGSAGDSTGVAKGNLSRVEQDLVYLSNWQEIEVKFEKHLQIITGNKEYALKRFPVINNDLVRSVIELLKV